MTKLQERHDTTRALVNRFFDEHPYISEREFLSLLYSMPGASLRDVAERIEADRRKRGASK